MAGLAKLSIYTRVTLGVTDPAAKLEAILEHPFGESKVLGRFEEETVKKTQADAIDKGAPIAGFIFKATMAPFMLPSSGLVTVKVMAGDIEYLSGILNLLIDEAQSA